MSDFFPHPSNVVHDSDILSRASHHDSLISDVHDSQADDASYSAQPSRFARWLRKPSSSQDLVQNTDERSIPIPLVGECGTDEIHKLIKLPKWKPWSKSSICLTMSGIRTGWYQNRERNIGLYLIEEFILGLVVVFAQIPETISFSLMGGMDPSLGLHGAWIIGLISTIFGGRGALVCGVTGSVSSVTASLIVATSRQDLVFPVVITSGIMLVIFSMLNLSWILRFISKNVLLGFCNGLAIIIGKAQLHMFKDANHEYVTGETAGHMVAMCFGAMLIFTFWERVPYVGRAVPSALMSLIFTAVYEALIVWLWRGQRTVSIGDIGRLDPEFKFPRFFWLLPNVGGYSLEDVLTIINKAFSFFLVMCLESLMTVNYCDVLYGNQSNADQSLLAIGISNIVSGLLGGLGGNTMIGLCGLLQKNKGCGKEACLVSAILLFVTVTCLSPYLNFFPTAGLAGIMFCVVIHTFASDSLAMIFCSLFPRSIVKRTPILQRRIPRLDALILLLVTILVPVYGLDVGILAGMILSAFKFVDTSTRQVQVYKHVADREGMGKVAVYDIFGPLFFSTADLVGDSFDFENDPPNVIIRMSQSYIMDYTAMEILSHAKEKYMELNKTMYIRHLTKKCEEKILLSQARLDWKKAHFDHQEIDVPKLVQFANELPCVPGKAPGAITDHHRQLNPSGRATRERLPHLYPVSLTMSTSLEDPFENTPLHSPTQLEFSEESSETTEAVYFLVNRDEYRQDHESEDHSSRHSNPRDAI